ncbi:MBL fold metallo-hydrolase [Ravibacter arvi]|uniref:MBL fold metallo-hydrolase n=1 Tax=Ravibacter arvi TaxID=2051041 RepID=A0ABP8MAS7_9BACT
MRLQFFGAAREVTGSKHLITTNKGTKILLDCGLFQGIQTHELNQEFGFDPKEIDCVILSHAHIDHSGLLPRLVKKGFNGPIYATGATAALCEIMLLDSAYIQEKDLKLLNERRIRQGRPTLELLYSVEDAQNALAMFKRIPYQMEVSINDGEVEFSLTDAGHLLGSAAVHLNIDNGGEYVRLTFTGDIGRPGDNILRSPEAFPQADYIICESTYGDRLHEAETDMLGHLERIVTETCVLKRGKLIVPAFAVDRTQELVYALDRLSSSGRLARIPVYIDSPLAVKATQIMKENAEYFNPEILDYIEKDGDAFAFPDLHYISSVEESKALNDRKEPCIIISASGMAEAGRIKHHLLNNLENEQNTVLIVGYCSPHTLGAAIRNGDSVVRIFGKDVRVLADVEIMDSFSGHADYGEMLEFLACQNAERVKKVFLVHGEFEKQIAFKHRLLDKGFKDIRIPLMRESVEI